MTTHEPADDQSTLQPETRAARRAQRRRNAWHVRATAAALTAAHDHLIDPGTTPPRGRWHRHIKPTHALMAATAACSVIVFAALSLWLTDPTSTHSTGTDPAVTDLRTYEKALDGSTSARAARDKIADRFVITDSATSTTIGRRSTDTGYCWALTVPKDATQPTRIARAADALCSATTSAPSVIPTTTRAPSTSAPTR